MSEPITRADYAKWLLSCGDLEMHAMFEDWCAHNPAESASPPPRSMRCTEAKPSS